MTAARDFVIIGGGHNALVTAFYLARAGRKPLVLERRAVAGGAAVTEEFHPGFRCSALAHAAGPVDAKVLRDMGLDAVAMVRPDPRLAALPSAPGGRAVLFYEDDARTAESIAKLSAHDAKSYPEFHRVLKGLATVVAQVCTTTPPDIDHPSAGDYWAMLKAGKGFRKLGEKGMFRLLRWGPMAVADLVAEFFENELVRAAIAARGVFGTNFGPWSAGSSAVLLLRAAADSHPAGSSSFPRGGMGALTQAMAAAATQAGAEIRTDAEVAGISVKDGVASGVVLKSGEEIPAQAVVSGADPRRTFLGLLDPVHLTPDFLGKMQNYRARGTMAKVNLALAALPEFPALAEAGALAGRIHIGPEIDYLEHAFDDAKYGDLSRQPYLDVMIPSVSDTSLAPAGAHVMSVCVQFAPYKLKSGDWKSRRDELSEVVVKTLAAYAPKLPQQVVARQIITPLDLEESYGLTGGHIFHGELALDQLFTMRPLLGWARYATPIQKLYLCGSGTHPGTGLTGISGANAAREILKQLK
jgi:phytoene dehydrogenase-like protein